MATDALVLWCLFLAVAVAAMVTYARLPARELYHVSNPGIDTGIRRGLAFAGFPAAPVAVAVVWLLAEHLTRRVVTVAAVAATVLASSVFWPGAVDEADPDSRPISVLALIAVVAVIALTVGVARSAGFRRPRLRLREERVRLAVFGLIFLVEIPWLAALIGVSLDHVPVLNSMYLSDSFVDQPGVAGLHPAVHAGLHHGLCGALLVTSSLWLSRHLPRMGNPDSPAHPRRLPQPADRLRGRQRTPGLLARTDRQARPPRVAVPVHAAAESQLGLPRHRRRGSADLLDPAAAGSDPRPARADPRQPEVAVMVVRPAKAYRAGTVSPFIRLSPLLAIKGHDVGRFLDDAGTPGAYPARCLRRRWGRSPLEMAEATRAEATFACRDASDSVRDVLESVAKGGSRTRRATTRWTGCACSRWRR